ASAMARRIEGVGWVTVSLRRSISINLHLAPNGHILSA
ncbi:uncharacterized protein METZ01_LOCUS365261, partial [marine metagenome]